MCRTPTVRYLCGLLDAIDPSGLESQREAVTERNPRTITLRARRSDKVPAVGMLLGAPKGPTVYRVLAMRAPNR